jgi:putative hydrolase of the HAD superfamily
VVFDWGGVLMRTHDYDPRLAWDIRLGLPPGAVERTVHGHAAWRQVQLGQIDEEEYWQIVGAELGLTAASLAELRRDFYRGDRLDKTLVGVIIDLKARGLVVGLLSNNVPSLVEEMTQLGVGGLFDACVISAQIGVMKPDASAFRAILERMDVPAEAAILIDDSPQNVAGAQAIGMGGVLFRPEIDLLQELEKWLHGH